VNVTERSRAQVCDAIDRLEHRFGVDRVVENRWPVSSAEYRRTRERFTAGTLGGAGAWVARDDGAVLLVREADRSGWSEPSGKHEPGESLARTARREVREETGVEVARRSVALAQRAVHVDRTDAARPPIHRLVVVFAGRRAGGRARAREPGVEAVDWFHDHPDDLLYDALATLPIPATW
jgi:ADP-ribose pyrophosphatase YjhB (NUDIX family)